MTTFSFFNKGDNILKLMCLNKQLIKQLSAYVYTLVNILYYKNKLEQILIKKIKCCRPFMLFIFFKLM